MSVGSRVWSCVPPRTPVFLPKPVPLPVNPRCTVNSTTPNDVQPGRSSFSRRVRPGLSRTRMWALPALLRRRALYRGPGRCHTLISIRHGTVRHGFCVGAVGRCPVRVVMATGCLPFPRQNVSDEGCRAAKWHRPSCLWRADRVRGIPARRGGTRGGKPSEGTGMSPHHRQKCLCHNSARARNCPVQRRVSTKGSRRTRKALPWRRRDRGDVEPPVAGLPVGRRRLRELTLHGRERVPEEGVAGGVPVLAEDRVHDDLPFLVVPAVGDHPIAPTEVHGPSLEATCSTTYGVPSRRTCWNSMAEVRGDRKTRAGAARIAARPKRLRSPPPLRAGATGSLTASP